MNHNVEQWQVRKRAVSSERGVVAAQNWMSAAAGRMPCREAGTLLMPPLPAPSH